MARGDPTAVLLATPDPATALAVQALLREMQPADADGDAAPPTSFALGRLAIGAADVFAVLVVLAAPGARDRLHAALRNRLPVRLVVQSDASSSGIRDDPRSELPGVVRGADTAALAGADAGIVAPSVDLEKHDVVWMDWRCLGAGTTTPVPAPVAGAAPPARRACALVDDIVRARGQPPFSFFGWRGPPDRDDDEEEEEGGGGGGGGGEGDSGRDAASGARKSNDAVEFLGDRAAAVTRDLASARGDVPSFFNYQKEKPPSLSREDFNDKTEEEREALRQKTLRATSHRGYQKRKKNRKNLLKQEKTVQNALRDEKRRARQSAVASEKQASARGRLEARRQSVQRFESCREHNSSLVDLWSRKFTGCKMFWAALPLAVWRHVFDAVDTPSIAAVLPRVCKHWRRMRPVLFEYLCRRRGWRLPTGCTFEEVFVVRYRQWKFKSNRFLAQEAYRRVNPRFCVRAFRFDVERTIDKSERSQEEEEEEGGGAGEKGGNNENETSEDFARRARAMRDLASRANDRLAETTDTMNSDASLPFLPLHDGPDVACFVGCLINAAEGNFRPTPRAAVTVEPSAAKWADFDRHRP
jgi:hypothetical protein